MTEAHTFVRDLALVFSVAGVATLLFQRMRQPAVLGYLLAGLLIGPHTPLPVSADHASVEVLAEFGIILVIFVIGLEFSVGKLVRALPISGLAGAVQISAMLWLGYLAGSLIGWSSTESLFLGGAICISSTMIVARTLDGRGEDSRLVDNVFGVLVVQDLVAIVLIAVFTAIAGGSGMPASVVVAVVGELVLFLVGAVAVGLLIVPRLIREANQRGSAEVVLVTSIGVCFGMALLARQLGYSVALGAFIAGSLIAESGARRKVEHLVQPIRDMFAAVFFVSIGMLVDPRAIASEWAMIGGMTAVVLVGHSLFGAIGSLLGGRSVRVAIRTGMTLAQIGEFGFILVGIGVGAGVVRSSLLAIAVGVAVITTFLTPHMVAGSDRLALWIEARLPRRVQTFTTLYANWFESLRGLGGSASKVRRPAIMLLVDLVVVAGVIVGFAAARESATAWISARFGVSIGVAGGGVLFVAVVVALPFVVGLPRNVHRLGLALAEVALPGKPSGEVDLADAPRRAFLVAVELGVTLVVCVPLIALTQPFLPLYAGLILLAAVLAGLGVALWRRAENLHQHYRAGAELVLEVLDRQRRGDDSEADARPPLAEVLPGLGPLVSIEIADGSPAVDRTLAEINLRARTGATVIAIHHASGEGVGSPTGHERLGVGDRLTLTGSNVAVESARRIVSGQGPELEPIAGEERQVPSDE